MYTAKAHLLKQSPHMQTLHFQIYSHYRHPILQNTNYKIHLFHKTSTSFLQTSNCFMNSVNFTIISQKKTLFHKKNILTIITTYKISIQFHLSLTVSLPKYSVVYNSETRLLPDKQPAKVH